MKTVAESKKPVYVNVDPNSVSGGNLANEIGLLKGYGYINDGPVTIKGIQLWIMVRR